MKRIGTQNIFGIEIVDDLIYKAKQKGITVKPTGWILSFSKFFANVDPRHAAFLTIKVRKV